MIIGKVNEEKNEDLLKSQIIEDEAKSLLRQNISQIDSLNLTNNNASNSLSNSNVSQSLQQKSFYEQAKKRYGKVTSVSAGNTLIEHYNMKTMKQNKKLSSIIFSNKKL